MVKHVALALCFDRLNAKDAPYRYIDTHAGIGAYDLEGDEGMRSPEWREGVGRVWDAERGAGWGLLIRLSRQIGRARCRERG